MLPALRFSQKNLVTAARLLLVLPFVLFAVGVRPPTAAAASGVTITWNNVHQTIDGFGASGAFQRASYLMNLPEPGRTAILDALFSQTTGAGLSIVRNVVNDDSGGMPSIEPSLNTWVWTGDQDQIWLMQQAQARGATRFLSTVWTPPPWMKDNGSVVGGSLATAHYQNYADYLSRYVREYQSRFGLDIYAVSLANEPCISVSYSSSCWTGAQFRDFIKNNLRPTFQADGVPAKVMIGEREYWDESLANESLADAVAVTRVDLVGGHAYGGAIVPFSNALNHGKRVWQTEVSYFSTNNDASITDGIRWAKMVHDFMRVDTGAFLYWWLVTEKTDGEGLVNLNLSNNTYTLNKRLFTLGNYARFVRPEYVRIGATANPAANIFTTAYRDPASNQFVVVVINDNPTTQTLDLTPSGFSAGSVTPYVTDSTRNLAQLASMPLTGVSLAAKSVTTFVGAGTVGGPTNTPPATATRTSTPGATVTPSGPTNTPAVTPTSTNIPPPAGNFLTNANLENGTTGWAAFGGGALSSDTTVFHGGVRSLKTSGRTTAWHGISQDVAVANFTNGQNYTVQVWVRTQTGSPTARATLRLTAGSTSYITLASAPVNATGWTLLSGAAPVSWSGTLTAVLFYVETAAGTDNLYIDDATLVGAGTVGGPTSTPPATATRTSTPSVTVTPSGPTNTPAVTPTSTNTPPPAGNFLTNADMENGATGWAAFGGGALSLDTTVFHGGVRSLKTSGRTTAWNGISQDVAVANFTNGQNYTVQVWVRTQTGSPTARATLRLTAGSTSYITLASAPVNATGWTLLSGTRPVSWSGTLTEVLFYVETAAGTDNLYIDDATLSRG